jgi:flagellar protein FlbD
MIKITRLNGTSFVLNPDLLERLEAHPDTVVHLVSGETYIVKESIADIISMIRSYRSSLIAEALVASSTEGAA